MTHPDAVLRAGRAGRRTEQRQQPAGDTSRGPASPAAVVVFWGGLLLLGAQLLVTGRRGWFYLDDWQLLGTRPAAIGKDDVAGKLLLAHDGQWSTLYLMIHRAAARVVGLTHYWPAVLMLLATLVTVAVLTRRLLVHVGAGPMHAAVAALVPLTLGRAASTYVWAFSLQTALGVALALALVLLLGRGEQGGGRDRRGDRLAAVVALAGVMTSGVGIAVTVAGAAWMVARRSSRWVVTVPAIVAYAGWYAIYGHRAEPGTTTLPAAGVWSTAGSVLGVLRRAAGGFLPWTVVGDIALAAVVASVAWCVARRPRHGGMALATALTGVLFTVITAMAPRRADVSWVPGERGAYVAAVCLLPVVVLAAQRAQRIVADIVSVRFGVVVMSALGCAVLVGNFVLVSRQRTGMQGEMAWARADVTQLPRLSGLDSLDSATPVDPTRTSGLTLAQLATVVHRFHLAGHGTVPLATRLEFQNRLYVTVEQPGILDQPLRFDQYLFGQTEATRDGCFAAQVDAKRSSYLWLAFKPTAATYEWVTITSPTGRFVVTTTSGRLISTERVVTVQPGVPTPLRVHSGGVRVVLHLSAGSVVCGMER